MGYGLWDGLCILMHGMRIEARECAVNINVNSSQILVLVWRDVILIYLFCYLLDDEKPGQATGYCC